MRMSGAGSAVRVRGGKFADGIAASPSVSLVYGLSSYNGAAGALNAATVTTIIYPSLTINSTAGLTIDHCEWYVDNVLFRDDDLDAPYEMKPGNVGVPFNVNPWVADGSRVVKAHLVFVGGSTLDTSATVTISGLGGGEPPAPPVLGRPDQSNTGHIAAGVATGSLTVYNGSPAITAGSTFNNYWFQSAVTIDPNNVTFNRCRFTGVSDVGTVRFNGTGGVMTDCTVNGGGVSTAVEGQTGVVGTCTLTRCDISGVENGVDLGSSSLLDACYIHDLGAQGSPHYDGSQMDGARTNITIKNSTINCPFTQTSAVMIDNYFGAATGMIVTGCWLSGGGYVLYVDGSFSANQLNATITNNKFEDAGQYGRALIRGANVSVTQSGNTDANGSPVTL